MAPKHSDTPRAHGQAEKSPLAPATRSTVFFALLVAFTFQSPLRAYPFARDPRALAGGETTVFVTSRHAFGKSLANLPTEKLRDHAFGNRLFNTNWVTPPASVKSLDGLGPVFNRVSCSGCHLRDGRGQPPTEDDEPMMSMLVRLSVPGEDAHGGPKPHAAYGDQLNDRAISGVPAEGRAVVRYEEISRRFPDGEAYSLLVPRYTFKEMRHGELGDDVMFSPRVAPAVFGLGLLEAVPETTILSRVDQNDANGDGVSGRANRVWSHEKKRSVLGRFGWKANQPSLRQQNAGALVGDIGITSGLFSYEPLTESQREALDAVKKTRDGRPEISDEFLDKLTFYTQTLAVPARRDVDDPVVQRGERLFTQTGCAACHTPTMTTGKHESVPQLSHQKIQPFTDLLLHDMGAELADGRPDYKASGREWRTPPLWGIGLVETVNRHTRLLHDGRARNLLEAIMWHGGEGEKSRDAFANLNKEERAAVIRFLESL